MDPAQIDRVEKLEKVWEEVRKLLQWRDGVITMHDVIVALDKMAEIMDIDIEQYP